MISLIKKASELPKGDARRRLLLAAVASGITSTYLKAAIPTFVLRAELPSTSAYAADVEGVARHLSISTREVKAAFPRSVLKVAVRFFNGAFVSVIEFPGANVADVQKYMSANYKNDPHSVPGPLLLAAATVDKVPDGKITLTWTNEGDVVLYAERELKSLIGAKAVIQAWEEADALPTLLRPIYDSHTALAKIHPPTFSRFPAPKLTVWTGTNRKSFSSPGEFTGFLNDVRDLKVPGFSLDFPESMIKLHLQAIERELAQEVASKAKWAEHGFSRVETLQHSQNARGNGASSYKVFPLPGMAIQKGELLSYFKGLYTPECGDTLKASPAADGTWSVYITRFSCD